MKNRDALTKSLHTVTVVSRVALFLEQSGKPSFAHSTDLDLCRSALEIVGQPNGYSTRVDETLQACVDKLKYLREKGVQV